MKLTVKQLARALYEAGADKDETAIKQITDNFLNILVEEGQIKKWPVIEQEFIKIWNQEKGIVIAKIKSASSLQEEMKQAVIDKIKERTGGKEIELSLEVDKTIIGGCVIRYDDEVLDLSLKNGLREMAKKLVS